MYQGKNPSALSSQRRIADAMMELMTARPFHAISVAALCRAAGVSRQTFYTLFSSRENVVLFLLLSDAQNLPMVYNDLDGMIEALCRNYSQYVVRKEQVLRLLTANGMIGVLRELLYESICGSECFRSYVRADLRCYAAGYIAAGLTSITETYLSTDADPDTLEEVASTLLRGRLFEC